MNARTKARLEKAGWVVGDAQSFLNLSNEEMKIIDTKIALARVLRERREELGFTQERIARAIGSSQPRIAKVESGDPHTSIELILKCLYYLDTPKEKIFACI